MGKKRHAPGSKVLAVKHITRELLARGALEVALAGPPVNERRPRTRGDCYDMPRPCPWVGCKHHLFLDVDPVTGSIKFNFPDLEPWELQHTCALDLADSGISTLEEVGTVMNITRERSRQIEVRGLLAIKSSPVLSNGGDR